jgi:hypothetical protein
MHPPAIDLAAERIGQVAVDPLRADRMEQDQGQARLFGKPGRGLRDGACVPGRTDAGDDRSTLGVPVGEMDVMGHRT